MLYTKYVIRQPKVHSIPHTFGRNPRKPQLHTKLSSAGLHLVSSFVEASFQRYLLLSVEMFVLTNLLNELKSLLAYKIVNFDGNNVRK